MDEDACYAWLLSMLHPGGLACPGCGSTDETDAGRRVYRRNRAPVLDHKCRACGRVFNAITGTALAGTHRRPLQLVVFLRGVSPFDCAQGEGELTAGLARELKASRRNLTLNGVEGHDLRQRLQANAAAALQAVDPGPLTGDAAAEADDCYVAAGGKPFDCAQGEASSTRTPATRRVGGASAARATARSPTTARRCWAWSAATPATCGFPSTSLRVVLVNSTRAELLPRVLACCGPGTTLYTDEWHPYATPLDFARPHATVCHNKQRPGGPEYARDDDGDGVREVHCNTLEGIWTGLRNFLRPFRGVSKWCFGQYVAVFEWAHNAKAATAEFIRAMLISRQKHKVGT